MTTADLVILLKWIAQVLLFASGVWALLGVEAAYRDDATGRRRLTANGWAKGTMLIVGLALFIASDVHERKTSEQRRKLAERDAYDKARQVDYLQRLILLQFELSALEVRWKPDSREIDAFTEVLLEHRDVELDPTERAYIDCAFRQGGLSISRTRDGGFRLDASCYRGQGMVTNAYAYGSPAWMLLERALVEAFGGLRVELESGQLVAEPLGRHWPCEMHGSEGELVFTLERPALRVGQLEDARVVLRSSSGAQAAPRALRLRSLDHNLELDTRLEVLWKPEALRRYTDPEGFEYEITRLRSGPHELDARLGEALRSAL